MSRPDRAQTEVVSRRLWGMRLALVAATALVLGLPQPQLQARQRKESLAQIAAERGMAPERVRTQALAAIEPLLDEAERSGIVDAAGKAALRRQLAATLAQPSTPPPRSPVSTNETSRITPSNRQERQ